MTKTTHPINGDRVSSLTDTEAVRLFLYFGCINDAKLENLMTELYGTLVSRGYDPLALTHCESDNDIIDCEVDNVQGTVTLSVPQELKVGGE